MIVTRTAPRRLGRSILVAAALAALGLVACGSDSGPEVTVLKGEARTVNGSRTTIDFQGDRVDGPRLRDIDVDGGWIIAGARWFDTRSWHDEGFPTCLERPLPQPIELGVLEADARDDAPGGGVVVWLKCLTRS